MDYDGNGPRALDRERCLALLRTVPVGRVVFTDRALPAIQPVNFALDGGGRIVVRTSAGSALDRATRGSVVAFQADDIDVRTGTGWSVTLVGEARPVTAPAEIEELAGLPLRAWTPARADRYIRIHGRDLTGHGFCRHHRAAAL
ncbi:pyridoxamine 5'-phosphate oxidase family protein [Actinomadura parmotrematis]|uniref:Pyridoxamine 5'-phosphate oxidase family protein n=1 Tax=Actinomadura parmotrematis TaxID=2864039 RepID=A0ABS7FSZ4_9ACTN|nr:pyridoxamine 5'-phosphate oxidase family protein [Actinomadura parmotrematis]MBW8483431.1 pyridoxamine 5'-phosphate oxidase family protein [Actinomadura parmotrematis]